MQAPVRPPSSAARTTPIPSHNPALSNLTEYQTDLHDKRNLDCQHANADAPARPSFSAAHTTQTPSCNLALSNLTEYQTDLHDKRNSDCQYANTDAPVRPSFSAAHTTQTPSCNPALSNRIEYERDPNNKRKFVGQYANAEHQARPSFSAAHTTQIPSYNPALSNQIEHQTDQNDKRNFICQDANAEAPARPPSSTIHNIQIPSYNPANAEASARPSFSAAHNTQIPSYNPALSNRNKYRTDPNNRRNFVCQHAYAEASARPPSSSAHATQTPSDNAANTEDAEMLDEPSLQKSREKASDNDDGKCCSCKKSQCLKMYCECFSDGSYCDKDCTCIGCFNTLDYEDTVQVSRELIEARNPFAFAPKVGDRIVSTPSSETHRRGCSCRKSRCLKNYCDCYQVFRSLSIAFVIKSLCSYRVNFLCVSLVSDAQIIAGVMTVETSMVKKGDSEEKIC